MHFHHYTLLHLAKALRKKFVGEQVQSCISQNKNELVIELESGYLRIGCHTPLTYIIPTEEYSRARKNVVNLFPEILGAKLEAIEVVPYERVMILSLDQERRLILKMHGIGANVLLEEAGKLSRIFNQKREEDWEYKPESGSFRPENLQVEPEMTQKSVLEALREISPIYDKQFASRAVFFMKQGQSFEQAYTTILEEGNDSTFYIAKDRERMRLFLFPQAGAIEVEGIIPALHVFQRCYYQFQSYTKYHRSLSQKLQKPLKKFRKVYDSYQKNVQSLETDRSAEELGHILMANLHLIESGSKSISVQDLYGEGEIKIKLDPKLNAQDNATAYYKKYKQRKSKLNHLRGQLEEVEEKLFRAEADWEELGELATPQDLVLGPEGFDTAELKKLHRLFKEHQKEENERAQNRYPYRTFQKEGFEIFVGKNARNNDELSFKFASKNDLWLHAKDVAGSHVVVRQKAGKSLPTTVLEYAAQLAAFYSKRKNDSLVPVLYTPRKYIRKRKGDPPGKVAVDRESVIMVEPIRT